jgi:hypothetical protein
VVFREIKRNILSIIRRGLADTRHVSKRCENEMIAIVFFLLGDEGMKKVVNQFKDDQAYLPKTVGIFLKPRCTNVAHTINQTYAN